MAVIQVSLQLIFQINSHESDGFVQLLDVARLLCLRLFHSLDENLKEAGYLLELFAILRQ